MDDYFESHTKDLVCFLTEKYEPMNTSLVEIRVLAGSSAKAAETV